MAGWRAGVRVALRVTAAVVAVVCVVVLALAGTARSTVLNRLYYEAVLDDEHAYERFYDQVLVDPAAAQVTRDLLAGLPVPRSKVLSNLKIVVPTATLRQLVDEQIGYAIDYLRGKTATARLSVDLSPVLQNVSVLAETYLGDLVASLQHRVSPDFPAFLRSLEAVLGGLARGQPPAGLPTVALDAPARARLLAALLAVVPGGSRPAARPLVAAALDIGDIASALATVGPYVLAERTGDARHDLVLRAGDGGWDLVPDLRRAGVDLGAVKTARSFARLALGPVQAFAVVLGLASAAFLWFSGAAPVHRRVQSLGAVLGAGGAVTLLVLVVARWQMHELVPSTPGGWPRSLQSLLDDLQHHGAARLFGIGLLAAAVPLLVGVLLVGGGWLWHRVASERQLRRRHRVALIGVGVLVPIALIGGTVTPSLAEGDQVECLGSKQMCALRYDQAAFLATHNSMSSTAARFIGPFQDPDIVSQLDQGARALLIDTHTWEQPDQIAAKLSTADFPPDLKARLPQLISRANPPKPGLWLCHAICRARQPARAHPPTDRRVARRQPGRGRHADHPGRHQRRTDRAGSRHRWHRSADLHPLGRSIHAVADSRRNGAQQQAARGVRRACRRAPPRGTATSTDTAWKRRSRSPPLP